MNSFLQWLNTPAGRALVICVSLVYVSAVINPGVARAQTTQPNKTDNSAGTLGADYRVGPGDHIYVSVPQRPDLNRQLTVGEDGNVNLPLVGNVQVKGLSKSEIEAKLLSALREYYPSVNHVDINVSQALSNVVFVAGEVRFPGKYSFPEQSVNLWEAIREAGGANTGANLSSVRVVQDRSRGGESQLVDVQAAIENGTVQNLPILRPGDTVIVPGADELYTGSSGVNVTGAVIKPGNYRLTGRGDLVGTILQAGGPTDRANLSSVHLIRPGNGSKAETYNIDLNEFLKHGKMDSNPKLKPGDTVTVQNKGFTGRDISLILSFVTALGTLVLLYYTIQNESTTSTHN
ncbi:MAG TPA: polysaccharide biosynthesis/export family protein [Candidatus Krumholzibacteria bacterium]|nr:polysaccharide biosynthesis/export family protein [Candidatus Krumholzibacteria bacterium]